MKKIILICVCLAAAGGLVWLVWFKPAAHEPESAPPASDVSVRVGKITRATLRAYVTAYGLVQPAPPGERPAAGARVASPVAGVLAAVTCAEGQRVEKGTVLFQLDTRAADVALEKGRRMVEYAEKALDRQQRLTQGGATSEKSLQDAELALATARNDLAGALTNQDLLRIRAPFAGTVTRINLKPGEAVDLATPLAELIDLDRLVVNVNVPAAELASLKLGQPAEVTGETPGTAVAAAVSFISPQMDSKTGTAEVHVALPANSGLRPGQFLTVRIVSQEHKDVLAAPVDSVVKDSAGEWFIALVEKDKAVQKPVKPGLRDGGLVEIQADGLRPDLPLVTEGAYGLPKETKIHVLEK